MSCLTMDTSVEENMLEKLNLLIRHFVGVFFGSEFEDQELSTEVLQPYTCRYSDFPLVKE